jgi:hypothetical protein
MVVIKSALFKKNIEEMVIQSTHLEQSLFNYFISNIITFKPPPSLTNSKNGKKQKTVKFSGVNQVYLIHTIDEIKEFLPDMYWKYDVQTNNDDYSCKNGEEEFFPLTRKKFVYERIAYATRSGDDRSRETKVSTTPEPNKTTPIVIPNYLYSTTQPNNLSETIERNTPPSKNILHLSTNNMFRDKVASCIFNTTCFDTNKRNDDVFKENTNSLPLILNELGIKENVAFSSIPFRKIQSSPELFAPTIPSFSYPLHSSNYKLLSKDKIPTMFDGIQCHIKV